MAKHTVFKNVLHGDAKGERKLYRKGETIDLTPEQAKPLIDIGHIADPKKKAGEVAAPASVALGSATLAKLTIAELTSYAQDRGISVPDGSTKDAILQLIDEATK
jgi:hypothetical protein